jgi:hypothetical protein
MKTRKPEFCCGEELLVAIAMDTDPAGFLEDAEITNFHDGT